MLHTASAHLVSFLLFIPAERRLQKLLQLRFLLYVANSSFEKRGEEISR
jgi:hypothetical protein